jgi:UDPglucose--hexose-1-phosphate uridylyltransferase
MTDDRGIADPRFDRLRSAPHRRHNALLDEWVLVSVGRTSRPWQGRREASAVESHPAYDPTCYLCPGNVRANGERNPPYDETFVFTNDFSALLPDSSTERVEDGLLRAAGEAGACRVLCFSPRHDLTLALMAPDDVRRVVDVWANETEELGRRYPWVQVFENRGQAMGASSLHPHGQIWAGSALPREATREDATQARHWQATGRRLLLDYAGQETGGPRVVEENDHWLVVVPFWATWPYETLVVARAPAGRLSDLDGAARDALAVVLRRLLARYDNLFGLSFPYSMGWHQAPFQVGPIEPWQLHAHFLPPLLQANVRKFMVGYELLAEAQRDLTAEQAAAELRAASPIQQEAVTGRGPAPSPAPDPSVPTATG